MQALTLTARAKVNLHLRVLGKRPDGYHELLTVFDRISLADSLELTPAKAISLECSAPGVPCTPENLVWRAAAAAIAEAGRTDLGVHMVLRKGVPAAAGLGGGSADAAAALVGVDRVLDLRLGERTLLELARRVGADVPFFVHGHFRDLESAGSGRMAMGKGVGENLLGFSTPPALFYVLMNPGFEVGTAWVFQAGGFGPVGSDAASTTLAEPREMKDVLAMLRNDLEGVTSARHPEIGQLLSDLRDVGAIGTRMSGSGPTVFGIFASAEDAARAGASLQRKHEGTRTRVFVARGE